MPGAGGVSGDAPRPWILNKYCLPQVQFPDRPVTALRLTVRVVSRKSTDVRSLEFSTPSLAGLLVMTVLSSPVPKHTPHSTSQMRPTEPKAHPTFHINSGGKRT